MKYVKVRVGVVAALYQVYVQAGADGYVPLWDEQVLSAAGVADNWPCSAADVDAKLAKLRGGVVEGVSSVDLLGHATRFRFGWYTAEWRGKSGWAVIGRGGSGVVFLRDGTWANEPSPSDRDESWFLRARWTREEAIAQAHRLSCSKHDE